MQQPLAHLYFVTVLHHLLSNDFGLTGLVRVAGAISEVRYKFTFILIVILCRILKRIIMFMIKYCITLRSKLSFKLPFNN